MYPMVCINTYEQPLRYERCTALFSSLQWEVEFYQTHRVNENPARACYEAHRAVATKYPQGVIIFEDDIHLPAHFKLERCNEVIHQAQHWLANQECDLFYLGCVPNIWSCSTAHIYEEYFKVQAICCHAYMLSPKAAKLLAQTPYTNLPIDDWWCSTNLTKYAYLPSLIDQGRYGSDIGNQFIYQLSNRTGFRHYPHQFANYYPYYSTWPLYHVLFFGFCFIVLILFVLFILYRQKRY